MDNVQKLMIFLMEGLLGKRSLAPHRQLPLSPIKPKRCKQVVPAAPSGLQVAGSVSCDLLCALL